MNSPEQSQNPNSGKKWQWDQWQKDVLEYRGNITIRSGRQVGKSEVISEKAARFALENEGTVTMIIAASQRQSALLFEKTRSQLKKKGEKFKEPPTLTKLILENGSKVYCLPAGRTGYFIRGFTIDLLIADEAAYIPEEVWKAVIPMIAVSRQTRGFGWIITISTPFGKGGYFYHTFGDPDFRAFHISSESCKRIPKDFLAKERQRLTKQEYAQEYLGEFVDEWNQLFPTDLLKRCMTFIEWSRENDGSPVDRYYLGVDFARYGGDENAFVIARLRKNKIAIVRCATTTRVSAVDTIARIKEMHQKWGFCKIFVDDAGLGGAITDVLQDTLGKRVVLGLNNSSRSVESYDAEASRRHTPIHHAGLQSPARKQKAILKEDLYSNALLMMETGRLEMISDVKLLKSLKSVQFEYTKDTRNLKITGEYSHLAEAMIRACWCVKEKGLDAFIAF